jgi:hypothetical protein
MSSKPARPILVTGSHRSGSTWVGRMIASHPRVGYIEEPFNAKLRPSSPVDHMWHHVTDADAAAYIAYLSGPLGFQHSWWRDVCDRPHPRRLVGATLRALAAWRRRWDRSRPLMKDPMAIFSAEWLADTFDMDVIVLIRHPLAFASSLKRLGWTFPFHHLTMQPRLLEDFELEPYRDEMDRLYRTSTDAVEHAILLWRIFHLVIRQYQRRHPDWSFLRHEDLSLRPVEEFQKLFARLGLDWHRRVRKTIAEHTSEQNVAEAPDRKIHELKRDSKANIWNWTHRLLPEEVARVRKGTEDLAQLFYPEPDWYRTPGPTRQSA